MPDQKTIDLIADAIEKADVGYSLRLTRLVDGESTYTLTYNDGDGPYEFPDIDEGYEHVRRRRRSAQAAAVLAAMPEGAASRTSAKKFLAEVNEFARWHHLNETALAAKKTPSDSEIDREVMAFGEIKRVLLSLGVADDT